MRKQEWAKGLKRERKKFTLPFFQYLSITLPSTYTVYLFTPHLTSPLPVWRKAARGPQVTTRRLSPLPFLLPRSEPQ